MSGETPESDAKEIELKLVFDPEHAAAVLAHPLLASGDGAPPGPRVIESKERELLSVYYDTPDDCLRKAGVFLRVRRTGTGYVQTIKTARAESEFLERSEWECDLPKQGYDLSAAAGTALEPLLSDEVRSALAPRFETMFMRRTFLIDDGGNLIEAAVDQGDIVAGEARARVCELELELKSGSAAVLFALAKRLAETVPLTLSVKTKAERGFDLLDGGEPDFEKALPVDIPPNETCANAFRIATRNCLRQVLANLNGTRQGKPEALHQMRVGLRRMRAAVLLFGDVVDGPERPQIAAELKWIANHLGTARDLDVFSSDIVAPHRAEYPDDPGWKAVEGRVRQARAEAQRAAVEATGSARFRMALLNLGAWIEFGDWTRGENPLAAKPVADYASAKLSRLRRSVVKKGKGLAKLSAPERHKVRIHAKRMRYGSEFFSATFPGKSQVKRCRKSLAALELLQDSLGTLNDIANRRTIFNVGGEHESVTLPVPKVDPGEEKALMKTAKHAYARFADVKPFWKA
ncbi:CYTH and CHAD domain-containing protein [Methyloceanibacter caenitepidi]|uniref:Adenylate cyclase n=1 Tax=Methyloceanibacter caenitepidi TaxID=1384459 RepID=A0A0A8K1Z8_9HYPH|nr:CYTH and CHAD domain-containing protein [Methyloceanibacter caenitepidi]BAQ16811.1 adenylate cyclase [Methyloceanibacter caenitepidi]